MSKIKVVSMVNDFGLGGTPRQIVTVDKYLNKDFFDHIVIGFNSSENIRRTSFDNNNVFNCASPEEVVKILNEQNIDILHVHRHGRNEPSHDAIAKLWGKEHIIMDLNIFSAKDTGAFGSYCQRHIFPSATNVWKYCLQNNEEFDFSKHNVVYTLFDSEHFSQYKPSKEEVVNYLEKLGVKPGAFVVGRLARPVIEKWDDEIIIMWKKLSALLPDAHFVALGVPEQRKENLRSAGDVKRLTILEPTASDRELALFYSSIDVLAHASPIGECSSGTIIEAMFYKKPVVVTSTPFPANAQGLGHTPDNGQIEQIKNTINGYVVNDGTAMAYALRHLNQHPEKVVAMGEINFRDVIDKFNVRVGIETLEKIYLASLLDKRGKLSPEEQRYYDTKLFFPGPEDIISWKNEYMRRLKDVYNEKENTLADKLCLLWWKALRFVKRKIN